ncbi:MAG: glycosyltransferase family 39 protein, partial [Gemmatimonadales bacterium]
KLPASTFALGAALVAGSIAALLAALAFGRNPHILDTVAQLFQARIFAQGHATAPAPERIEFFIGQFLLQHDGRWFSQYPPGHSVLLALGMRAGVPWLVNPLVLAATVPLVYGIARRLLGEGVGRLATLLFALAPFVLLMSGSYMNHVTAVFFLALALYAVVRVVQDGIAARWVAAAGFGLGFAVAIRPLESLAWGAVLVSWVALRRGWKPALALGVACVVAVTPLAAYNAITTGHPLRFGYTLLWGSGHGLGFHPDPWGEPFTPLRSLANTSIDFQRLNAELFGWPLPSLLFVLLVLAWAGRDAEVRKGVGILVATFLAAPCAYFFYWHHDSYLGPRFLFASVIPAVLLTAAGIGALDRRLRGWRPVLRIVVAGAIMYSVAISLPRNAGVVAGMAPEFALHPERQARRENIREAVVFVKVGWGSRLVGRLRGWQLPAAEVERSLRSVDGCRLQRALDEADASVALGSDPARVAEELRSRLAEWRSADLPLGSAALPDVMVRLDATEPLSERCLEQVRWDQSGFVRYEPFVWRNDPWLRRGVIYARYLEPQLNARLISGFPGRPTYLYAPASSEPGARPVLVPLTVPSAPAPDGTDRSASRGGAR